MVQTEQEGFGQSWDKALLGDQVERKVLIVDGDPQLIQAIRETLKRQGQGVDVIVAKDGKRAERLLRFEPITVVLYDLKVPKESDIELLKYLGRSCPDVEIIAITGLGGQKFQSIVGTRAGIEYIESRSAIDDIVEAVKKAFERQVEGGVLHGVLSSMFVQLIEMERRTCTVRLVDNSTRKIGALFFREGILIDARFNGLRGEEAAYEIFSWDRVSLGIQNSCYAEEKKIKRNLRAIIFEAMRRKDEICDEEDDEQEIPEAEVILLGEDVVESEQVAKIKKRLDEEELCSSNVVKVWEDSAWDSLLIQSRRIGAFFDAGDLKVAYVDKGEDNNYVLVPGQKTVVIAVDGKSPRDKFIDLFKQV